jgi:spore coat polysaccharide biosynthesis protein SpsF
VLHAVRVGGLVHARVTSSRLPGKQLKPIAGRPAIAHLLDRMAACDYLERDRIILCTPEDAANDELAATAEREQVRVFRGSELDIIDRYYRAAEAFGFDAVVQVDGDDPCADPSYMTRCMSELVANDLVDVVVVRGLPIGVASKAIRFSALERVWEKHVPSDNSTGYSLYLTASGLCTLKELAPVSDDHVHDRARLTLDHPEDLAFFEAVFEELYEPGRVFGIGEIVALLRRRPELVEINSQLSEASLRAGDEEVEREQLLYRADGELRKVRPR